VGGKAAHEIGKRLVQLAHLTQVVVVTHLAQVAAFADQQLVVAKTGGETTVGIVEGKAREKEIARMLSGSDDSATALKHARELLATAQKTAH
jgi:DNA repair protein RecN (Recombination protein N)